MVKSTKMYRSIATSSIKIPRDYPRYLMSGVTNKSFSKNIIYPIVIDQDNYLLDGYRRLTVLRKRGKRRVRVLVKKVPKGKRLETSLILSMQHKNLNPMEKAKAFKNYIDSHKPRLSQRAAAKKLKVSKAMIEDHLRLLSMPREIQKKVEEGKIKMYNLETFRKIRVKSLEDFRQRTAKSQFFSIMNRLTTLEKYVVVSNFEETQFKKVLAKVNGIKFVLEGRLKNGG